jgi:isopenicillin N synthase-like dioxygenase
VGFFTLSSYRVFDPELIDEITANPLRFFGLPVRQELAIENVFGPQFRGYTRASVGAHSHGDVDSEQVDIGVERAAIEPGPGIAGLLQRQGTPTSGPQLAELQDGRWPAGLKQLSDVALRLYGAEAASRSPGGRLRQEPSPAGASR